MEELVRLRRGVEAAGLKLEAIENFDPAHWHDVLLDGPKRERHIENVKMILRRMGEAGIPIMGYNFSLAGVAGRVTGRFARGGAESVGMDGPFDLPMPNGMVWNMVYDPDAPPGVVPPVSTEELWRRAQGFLRDVIDVSNGGKRAAQVMLQRGVVRVHFPGEPAGVLGAGAGFKG